MGRGALLLVLATACGGCLVDVDFGNTRFRCQRDGTCPGGFECVEETCVREDAPGPDGGGGTDAPAVRADAAALDDEDAAPIVQCGVVELDIALGETINGTTVGGGQELGAGCIESDGAEVVHRLVVEGDAAPVTLQATSDFEATGYDAVIYVRRACDDPDTELGCDDAGTNGDTVTFVASEAGVYHVVVDSHAGGSGSYQLLVTAIND